MKYLKILLGLANPVKTIVWNIIKNIAAAFITKRMVIWVLAEGAKHTSWEWDNAAVRLLVAADEGNQETIQNAIISLEAAIKMDYLNSKKSDKPAE